MNWKDVYIGDSRWTNQEMRRFDNLPKEWRDIVSEFGTGTYLKDMGKSPQEARRILENERISRQETRLNTPTTGD